MIIGAIGPTARNWSDSMVDLIKSNLLGANPDAVYVIADSGFGLMVAYASIGACFPTRVVIPQGYSPVGEYVGKLDFALHFGREAPGNDEEWFLQNITHALAYYKSDTELVKKARAKKIPVRNLYGKGTLGQ